jgi:hypothetical protein
MKTIPLFKNINKLYEPLTYGKDFIYLGSYKKHDCYLDVYKDTPESSVIFIKWGGVG